MTKRDVIIPDARHALCEKQRHSALILGNRLFAGCSFMASFHFEIEVIARIPASA